LSLLEWVAVAFGVAGVLLTVRQNPWCWPLGIVNVSLSAVVFWETRLYADAALQIVYVALCSYGWWAWLRGGTDSTPLHVSRAPRSLGWLAAAAAVAFAWALGSVLHRATDAALPFWDAGTASGSLLAQWMQTRKWLENWTVWIVVDVVYVGMYVAKGLMLFAGLYALFGLLAVLGLREWRRSLGQGTSSPAVAS
jgi:nicotinamide mononucleotide transporter